MPKISKKYIKVKTDKIDKAFETELFYNKDFRFYIKLPSEFINVIETIHDDEKKRKDIKILYNKGYPHDINSYIATGENEAAAESNFIEFMKLVFSISLIERKVIFIKCHSEFDYDREVELNDTVGGRFAILYGIETKTTATAKPKYYEVVHTGYKKEVNMGYNNTNYAVIDDTPEMRATLENLHSAINTLFRKLEKICTAENIHQLTSVKQLLQ